MSHVPLLALERFVVRDLPAGEAEAVRAHADECAVCRGRIDALAADDRERLARMPPAAFVRRLQRPRPRRWAWALALGAAAAAGLFVSAGARTRFKGAGVIVHRLRDGSARRLEDGDRIRAGDELRISLVVPAATTARVWFVEGGRVTPLGERQPIAAGEQLLDGAVRIEPPCNPIRIVISTGGGAVARQLECE